MFSLNPSCYLPSGVSQYLPSSIACPPPPSYLYSVYSYITSPFSSTFTTLRTAMSALISLPFLSFLLIPTMTSYSTSLNLLFFYLTWSTLVLSHPPLRVELVATLAVRFLFYILPSTVFLTFDALLPSAALSFKACGPAALPLRSATRTRALRVLRMVGWSLANTLSATLVQITLEVFLTEYLGYRSALKVSTSLPYPWGILKDLLRGYLVREVISYTLHRYILHEGYILPKLASAHESWYHSLSTPIPLSASYDHPASFLLRSFLPTFLPALIFRFHLLTYIVYLTLISLEETWVYSGYSSVAANFILGGIARRTDTHVLCGGEGNFGAWGLMDWIAGTSVGGDVVGDVWNEAVKEAEEHDLDGKVRRIKEMGSLRARRVMREMRGVGSVGEGSGSGIKGKEKEVKRRRARA